MMRVIRTEMYFSVADIPFTASRNPGVAFAWFGTGADVDFAAIDTGWFASDFGGIETVGMLNLSGNGFENFLAAALLNSSYEGDAIDDILARNPGIRPAINSILASDIVVERSPPSIISVRDLARNVSSTSVGTYMGFASAGDNHALLFLTVPLGIVMVGAAVGVSKALESGLNKSIARLIQQNSPNPRRPRSRWGDWDLWLSRAVAWLIPNSALIH
jgi:hypothetical protein